MKPAWLRKFPSLPLPALLFFVCSFLLAAGFVLFDAREVRFAKLGIPLSRAGEASGAELGQAPKIFVTELFLALLFGLVIWQRGKGLRKGGLRLNGFFWACLFLLCTGLARALPDLPGGPVLVVRNACFIWYLLIPLLVFLLEPPLDLMESWARGIYALGFCAFWIPLLYSLLFRTITLNWIPFLGLYPCLHLIFFSPNPRLRWFSFATLGVGFGWGLILGLQRTNLLGALLLLVFLFPALRNARLYFLRLAQLVFSVLLAFLLGLGLLHPSWERTTGFNFHTDDKVNTRQWGGSFSSSPIVKGPSNAQGLEVFRTQMWKDAWDKFSQRPLLGIGFREQVVYRLLAMKGPHQELVWVPNDGKTYPFGPAPVSGPHNSYLNALARMGILGLGFLGLHLWALWILWRSGRFFLFSTVFAGVVYAAFNVGLEGPVRSFILLIGLGAAALTLTQHPNPDSPPSDRVL